MARTPGRPVVAVIDDYEGFVAGLDAWAALRAALPGAELRILSHQPLTPAHWPELADVHYLVLTRERTRVGEDMLAALPQLVALVQTGTCGARATSHVDLAACERRGIAVIEGGSSDGFSTAELTWALILAANRQLPAYVDSMRRGQWQAGNAGGHLPRSLRGQTLGIVGYGRIGQLVGGFAKAFEMAVLAWGGERSRRAAEVAGVEFVADRDRLFARSDVLSLHLRMNPETRHGITLRELMLMKPSALLVNTARPGLIAPGALEAARAAGRPGRVALDVHADEPVLAAQAPGEGATATLTPHIGYVERGSYETLFGAAFARIPPHVAERGQDV